MDEELSGTFRLGVAVEEGVFVLEATNPSHGNNVFFEVSGNGPENIDVLASNTVRGADSAEFGAADIGDCWYYFN